MTRAREFEFWCVCNKRGWPYIRNAAESEQGAVERWQKPDKYPTWETWQKMGLTCRKFRAVEVTTKTRRAR